ncbi:MAG: hypothetical protein HN341_02340 [Verrucomicrobia bacterium]|jgi:hypothetical protein|nr:hypothetical protein [Verrucomicrobiota bacterium]
MPIPTFLIVGAAKAGTTSLYHYLKQHPDVFMPKLKEPHYFAQFADELCKKQFYFLREWNEYLALFEGAGTAKAIGESSVSYLCHSGTAQRIRDRLPDVKIIICLRNPVERVFSHFLMDIRDGKLPCAAELLPTVLADDDIPEKMWGSCNLFLECGRYARQVAEYFEVFGRDSVRVILYEDFKTNPIETLHDLYAFLGINTDFTPQIGKVFNTYAKPRSALLAPIYSSYQIRRLGKLIFPDQWKQRILGLFLKREPKPEMTEVEMTTLYELYQADVEALEDLLGFDLSAWRH